MRHRFFINSEGKALAGWSLSFKRRLAAAMVQPLRTLRDYAGIARKAFQVEPSPQGVLPSYEKKPAKYDKFRISNQGKASHRIFGRRVTIPEFEVFSNPTIRITDVKERRFNLIDRSGQIRGFRINSDGKAIRNRVGRRFVVIDRVVQKARAEIMAQEDAAIFQMLDDEAEKK